jgi:possible EA31 gene protein, phage lambda
MYINMEKTLKINIPDIDFEEMVNDCIKDIRDDDKRNRINNSKSFILSTSSAYKNAVKGGCLYKEKVDIKITGGATRDDMIYLYEKRLVESKKGRKYYDKIKANAPMGKCPICDYNLVDTIDHYLPKTIFYQYAITVENLLPECAKCNKNKTDKMAYNRIEELIHPYFDDFDNDVWLHASIDKNAGEPFGFKYGVEKPQTWDEEKFNRAKNHLSVYKLDSLYMILAASEINKELLKLKGHYLILRDKKPLKEIVNISLEVEKGINRNSWKTAMLQCIYDNDWFWDTFIPQFLS